MKKYIITTCTILLFLANKAITQNIPIYQAAYKPFKEFKGDTMRYLLESFMDRKEYYIGKQLVVLLNDMEIPVKSYTFASHKQGQWLCYGSYFYFVDAVEKSWRLTHYKSNPGIWVEWDGVPMDTIIAMLRTNHSDWKSEESSYYGKLFVKDIQIGNGYGWHTAKVCPGFGDVYYFAEQKQVYHTERVTYQLSDGTKYGLSSYNPLLLDDFLIKYPNHGLLDPKTNDIDSKTEAGKAYAMALAYFQDKDFNPVDALQKGYTAYLVNKVGLDPKAQALAYVLKKFDTGIVLLKVAANGKYYGVYDNMRHAP